VKELSEHEKHLLSLSRTLTKAGHSVTDEDMAQVETILGPEKTVALVHTIAFANFHFRIIQALGVAVEPQGPLPPVPVPYSQMQSVVAEPPARPAWTTVAQVKLKQEYAAPKEWLSANFTLLEERLDKQKARQPRITLPTKERLATLPTDAKRQTDTIVWMTVSSGYQPDMTMAWFGTFRGYQSESRMNQVFSSSLFWVVTRANDCFY
jgi:hypothetical protein